MWHIWPWGYGSDQYFHLVEEIWVEPPHVWRNSQGWNLVHSRWSVLSCVLGKQVSPPSKAGHSSICSNTRTWLLFAWVCEWAALVLLGTCPQCAPNRTVLLWYYCQHHKCNQEKLLVSYEWWSSSWARSYSTKYLGCIQKFEERVQPALLVSVPLHLCRTKLNGSVCVLSVVFLYGKNSNSKFDWSRWAETLHIASMQGPEYGN